MAVPSYGPSHRVEISNRYLEQNERGRSSSKFRLFDMVEPAENVADEGQVVLLDTQTNSHEGSIYACTQVIPDAAGYEIDQDISKLSMEKRACFLQGEMHKFKVGINQVERGIGSANTAAGYGWDISYTPGHPVNIMHTGCEPIHRFDFIGVRFPSKQDMSAQSDRWNTHKHGASVSRFATYPIAERWETMKFDRFWNEVKVLKEEAERGYTGVDVINPLLELVQLPALMKVAEAAERSLEEDSTLCQMKQMMETGEDVRKANIWSSEQGTKSLLSLALSALEFAQTLRPPFLVAKVLDFQCVQPQMKSFAQTGDTMRCILM